jgi:hypothetical protein
MTDLDQILKKLAEQFNDIDSKIAAINKALGGGNND